MNLSDQYRQMHEDGHFKGYSLMPHVDDIAALVKKYNARTLLDYGCGKGLQYTEAKAHEVWGGIMPTLYDPYVGEISIEPDYEIGKFDGLICTDVAEHLENEHVAYDFLQEIFAIPEEFIFITICTRPAKKNLPNGRNCHTLVRNQDWWMEMITQIYEEHSNMWCCDEKGIFHNSKIPDWYVKFVE